LSILLLLKLDLIQKIASSLTAIVTTLQIGTSSTGNRQYSIHPASQSAGILEKQRKSG